MDIVEIGGYKTEEVSRFLSNPVISSLHALCLKCVDFESLYNDALIEKSHQRIAELKSEVCNRTALYDLEDLKLSYSRIEKEVYLNLFIAGNSYFLDIRKHFLNHVSSNRVKHNSMYKSTTARCAVLKYYSNPPVSTNTGLFRPQSVPHILDFKTDKFNVYLNRAEIPSNQSNMKVEAFRLLTFQHPSYPFPAAHIVKVEDLAANGFYYTFEDDNVQCAFCKGILKDWQPSDDPAVLHRLHYATCPHVLYLDVGNVKTAKNLTNTELPLSQVCSDDIPSVVDSDMKSVRYVSGTSTYSFTIDFQNVIPNETIDSLTQKRNLLNSSFTTAMNSCHENGTTTAIDTIINTIQYSQKYHSFFPVSEETAEAACSPKALDNLSSLANRLSTQSSAEHFYPIKYSDYKYFETRLKSFKNWYPWLIPHWLMAKAGFFFNGEVVTRASSECYWCGLSIMSWSHVDNPWIEHARWSPRCVHVLMERGAEFVLMVHKIHPPYRMNHKLPNDDSNGQKAKKDNRNVVVKETREPLPILTNDNIIGGDSISVAIEYRVEPRDIKGRMDLPSVRTIMALGFTSQEVRAALDLHMKQSGDDFRTAEMFLHSVWKQRNKISSLGIDVDEYQMTRNEEIKKAREDIVKKRGDRKRELATGDWRLCKICMDNEVSVVFLNCGHLCSCAGCAPSMKTCPMCRAPIRGTVSTFTT